MWQKAVALVAVVALWACTPPPPPQPVDACGGACTEDQVCVRAECVEKVCEPFETACRDTRVLATCNGNGTAVLEEECPANNACFDGGCIPIICDPGTAFCGTDGVRKVCAADGLTFSDDPCQGSTGCSGAGECVPQICSPLSVECIEEGGRDVMRCSLSGTEWVEGECQPSEACLQNECKRLICAPGEPACADGSTSGICDPTGTQVIDHVACDPATASVCNQTTGQCDTACALSALTKSYIGCDYWFAVTHNIEDDVQDPGCSSRDPGYDDFPSAVVIANTNNVPTQVTLYDGSGNVVTLPDAQQLQPWKARNLFGQCEPLASETAVTHSQILVADGTVTPIDSEVVDGVSIPPGSTAQFLITSPAIVGTRITSEAFHVESTLPVSAYFFHPICCNFSFSNDASLLIPSTAWRDGYFAVAPAHLGGSFSDPGFAAGVAVIASQDETEIALRLGPGQVASQFKIENGVPSFVGNELRTTLQRGQVLQLETRHNSPRGDVTGLLVAGSKPIGVFGFHTCVYAPSNLGACDHVEEMMLPIETWGKEYIAVMPKLRNPDLTDSRNEERSFYRVVSAAPTNRVIVSPKPTDADGWPIQFSDQNVKCPIAADGSFVLGEGQFCELSSREDFQITADQPVLVGVVLSGQGSTNLGYDGVHAGDPSLTLLVPVNQFRQDYSFLTPDTYFVDYVTVIFKSTTRIELDGVPIDNPSVANQSIGSNTMAEAASPIPGTEYQRMTISLSVGAHRMRALRPGSDAPGDRFGIFNYGYDDYVSYAYPGGLDLVQMSEYPNLPDF